jgi:hypothetical protein
MPWIEKSPNNKPIASYRPLTTSGEYKVRCPA